MVSVPPYLAALPWAVPFLAFIRLARHRPDLARAPLAGGRLVSVLEGGYELTSLGRCAALHVRALLEI